ncbi:MAG: OsmC family protein [Candidatus Latescibacterota bacterium]
MQRKAQAVWTGSLKQGRGTMRLGSGAFEGSYSVGSRFENATGTNPEELIGAAHAGCFSMALSALLGQAGHDPERIETSAEVAIEKQGEGWTITSIALRTRGRVPGMDAQAFQQQAQAAKEGCPVSRALAGVKITLHAELEQT